MEIKVISLNMWWGGHLFSQILEFLKRENADIVMLQEVYNASDSSLKPAYRSMQVLAEELDYEHAAFVKAYTEAAEAGKLPHGNAVLSRFPITHNELRLMSEVQDPDFEYKDIPEHWPILPSPLQLVELDTPAGKVTVCNVHGVWDLDGDSYSEKRQHMSQVMLETTRGRNRLILAGDTNAKSTNRAMRELEPQLVSVFGTDLKTTFNMQRKDNPGYATAAVDLMFVSPDVKVISKDVPDVDISDHLPLVVTLEIA